MSTSRGVGRLRSKRRTPAEAPSADRPTVLEMVTDPTVPPAPPHITAKQLRHYASALLQGDPQALQIAKSSAREWWEGLMPSRN